MMLTRLRLGTLRVLAALGRNVFELFLMLLAALAGIEGILQPEPITPGSIEPLLPPWGRVVWYGGLLLGSTIATLGLAIVPPHGARAEQAGLLILIGSGLSYTMLTMAAGAWSQAVIVLVFVLVLAVRIYYLRWEPKAFEAAVRLLTSEVDGA